MAAGLRFGINHRPRVRGGTGRSTARRGDSPPVCLVHAIPVLLLAGCLSGCIALSRQPPYPADWARPATERVGACVSIAGRYGNAGQFHLEAGRPGPCASRGPTEQGLSICSPRLSDNLGIATIGAIVALSQPDADHLDVAIEDKRGERLHERRLRRGRDYQCDDESLFFSDTGSLLGGPGWTAFGVLFLTGGANHHSRAFARNAAGELVMTVRERQVAYHLVVGVFSATTYYVRWRAADAAPAAPGAAR